jgi:hypothetical protein
VRAHFVDASGIDAWESWYYLAPCNSDGPDWTKAEIVAEPGPSFDGLARAPLSARSTVSHRPRNYKAWGDALETSAFHKRQHVPLPGPEDGVRAGRHGERAARALAQALREKRDAAVDALRKSTRPGWPRRRPAAPRRTED